MDKKTALTVLLWCIRLSMCGMPVGYIRYLMIKKHEELENCEDARVAEKFPREVSRL